MKEEVSKIKRRGEAEKKMQSVAVKQGELKAPFVAVTGAESRRHEAIGLKLGGHVAEANLVRTRRIQISPDNAFSANRTAGNDLFKNRM